MWLGGKKKKEDWMAGNIVNSCHGVLLPWLQMCEDPMQLLPLGSPYNQSQASAPLGTILNNQAGELVMEREACRPEIHGGAKNRTRLSN